MQAWKRPDGRYDLIGADGTAFRVATALEVQSVRIPIEKILGVITGPSSCGCEPAMFRWVGEREVAAGRTKEKRCPNCDGYEDRFDRADAIHQCDIIEVLGEPDVARQVYDAEFKSKVEAIS